MSFRADVVIAGAGIAGSSLAYELSRRGVSVLLLERQPLGPAGASSVPAALINPHRGRTARASAADLNGATALWSLARQLEADGSASGAHRTGVLRVADNARQALAWRKLADEPGANLHWLQPPDLPACYHAPFGALLVADGGWIESRRLLSALAESAARLGASVARGVELVTVGPGGAAGQLTALVRQWSEPQRLRPVACRALVIATGAHQPAGVRLPRLQLVGGQAQVLALGFTPPYPLAGAVVAAFQDGRALVSGGHVDLGPSGQVSSAAQAGMDLTAALSWQLPAAADAAVLSHWSGVRAKRPSGQPVARRLREGVYLLGAFGGRGFLRAADVAARMAEGLSRTLKL